MRSIRSSPATELGFIQASTSSQEEPSALTLLPVCILPCHYSLIYHSFNTSVYLPCTKHAGSNRVAGNLDLWACSSVREAAVAQGGLSGSNRSPACSATRSTKLLSILSSASVSSLQRAQPCVPTAQSSSVLYGDSCTDINLGQELATWILRSSPYPQDRNILLAGLKSQ